jgi:hypothetical protein
MHEISDTKRGLAILGQCAVLLAAICAFSATRHAYTASHILAGANVTAYTAHADLVHIPLDTAFTAFDATATAYVCALGSVVILLVWLLVNVVKEVRWYWEFRSR